MRKILAQNRQNVEQIQQNQRDVTGIGFIRSELTLKLAERLKMIATLANSPKALLVARKLAFCGSQDNIYVSKDFHNSDGECFEGVGHLWSCSLAYCQNCEALKARVRRKKVRDTLKQLKQPVGTSAYFVTLTSQDVPVPLLVSIKVYLRAWELFRQKRWFDKTVWAGWKNIEFTVNENTKLNHVHLHSILISKFLRPSEVRATWQECITNAWNEVGVSQKFGTKGAVVRVDDLPKGNRDATEKVILELCKYTSKGSDWLLLSDSDLLDVSQGKLPRLFSSFGKAHRKSNSKSDTLKKFNTPVLKEAVKKPRIKLEKPMEWKVNRSRLWRLEKLESKYPASVINTLKSLSEPQPKREPQPTKLRLIKGNKKQ